MCGIAGVVDFAGRPVEARLLLAMSQALEHRGPDDRGLVTFPSGDGRSGGRATAGLASARLSIIDVQGGHQPVSNEDGTVWAVLNGEIYNFQELRDELERKGHRFATRSDTEVIVHLYEERGENFVEALDGMFALALWHDERQSLLLARDRFGKKPLFYAEVGSRLVFASELQALLLDPAVGRDLDMEALDYYLTYMAIPAPLSIYRGVRKLPPAHVLTRDRRGAAVRRYWSLRYAPKLDVSEEDATRQALELLTAAVRKRLVSDVPVGALLSGGIDSSAVVALMSRFSSAPVKTFSIGFAEERYNELPHARRVAEAFGCEHHEFVVRPRAVDVLPTLVRHFGEPFADSSAIPTYYLSRLTRRHVTVALNGDGGDETFAGYGRHLANRLAEGWRGIPAPLRMAACRAVARLIPSGGHGRRPAARLKRFLEAAALSRSARYQRWAGVFTDDLKATVVTYDGVADGGIVDRLFAEFETLDAVDSALAVDTLFYLPTDLLVKMDIMTMANSLEARSPFLDHHLVEFVARLPSRLKLRGRASKYLLKRALSGIVPEENLRRGKQGFAVPIAEWLRGELSDFLKDHLLGSRFTARGLFRADGVAQLVAAHQSGRADHGHQLWVLLMLELWYRSFVDGRPGS